MFFTSLLMGVKIRTMWMTPFYLFLGVLFLYIYQEKIILKKIKYFYYTFSILFIFSPILYLIISITQIDKRTDYPGKKISKIVQKKWDDNFTNQIALVAGNEWHGGNLSYHLKSRPRWDDILESKNTSGLNEIKGGFIIIGDPNTLLKICSGVFFELKTEGICMIGKNK